MPKSTGNEHFFSFAKKKQNIYLYFSQILTLSSILVNFGLFKKNQLTKETAKLAHLKIDMVWQNKWKLRAMFQNS